VFTALANETSVSESQVARAWHLVSR